MDRISIILKLGEHPAEYSFSIDRRENPPILHIPGDHRGPDLCFPWKPEQEEWLNTLRQFMKPYWHCQWKFNDLHACEDFLRHIETLRMDLD